MIGSVAGIGRSLSEAISVALTGNVGFTKALIESFAVVKAPTQWFLLIQRNDTNTSLEQGTISPAVGLNAINSGNTCIVTATTEQFNIYVCMYVDGTQQSNNSSTSSELIATQHTYTVPAQTAGTIHLCMVSWSSAWELAISAGSNGSVNVSGTYEVKSGNSGPSVTATPITNYHLAAWLFDGQNVGTANPYSAPTQADGTTHTLVATFAHN
jgi:hypothetical protein